MNKSLVNKYNVSGPRYTSYPTVPFWDEHNFKIDDYKELLVDSFIKTNKTEGVSLYIHLPFCEQLCTFCGCNKRITKRHEVEEPYIEILLKEWQLYLNILPQKPVIKEIHLGGGTPTFFAPNQLSRLINSIVSSAELADGYEFSFEGHPNNTTESHLQTLFDLGFRRVSFGVQDYNPLIQMAIHRIQPFDNVKRVTELARTIGYTSVGHDLIFGLPFQTEADVIQTISLTQELKPDRIAFYSYAHVPWIKGNGQRGFKDSDLPTAKSKRAQYQNGKQLLESIGYVEIGMDHFALTTDSLYVADKNKRLHRNFMGYTASKTTVMVGLGVSSISDCWTGFAQNEKNLEDYQYRVHKDELPIFRGHILNSEDRIIRQHILNLMCNFETHWEHPSLSFNEIADVLVALKTFEEDGLITLNTNGVVVHPKGRPFIRNICMAFDLRLQRKKPDTQLFSMTI